MPYYSLVTEIGAAQLTNALALGSTVRLTHFAVGLGDTTNAPEGEEYDPLENQTALKNEQYRAPINALSTVEGEPNILEVQGIVPNDVGGWHIREVGLFDDSGNMIVIAKYPSSYKPKLAEGAAQDFSFKIQMATTNAAQVELKVDPAQVLATKQYVVEQTSPKADANHGHSWDEISEKPAAFMPIPHTHTASEISGLDLIPVGTVLMTSGAVPLDGTIAGVGATLLRANYPRLFTFAMESGNMATSEETKEKGQYGPGDGVTTFSTPDYRDAFPRFHDDRGSRPVGSWQDDEVRAHDHPYGYTHNQNYGLSATAYPGVRPGGSNDQWLTNVYGGEETRPKNITFLACIKF